MANSVSHGLGLLAALCAAPYLILHAVRRADVGFIVGVSVFSAAMVLLYAASMVYHALPRGPAKGVFRAIERGAIFLLIAGTYTAFTLGVLRGAWGWRLFAIIWALAALGLVHQTFGGLRRPVFSTSLYVGMGWVVIVAIRQLWLLMPPRGFLCLVLGGLAYTIGVPFYATDRRRYHHFIWHLFVVAGTIFHCFAVLWSGV